MVRRILDDLGATRGNPLRPFLLGYLGFIALAAMAGGGMLAASLNWVWAFLALLWPLTAVVVLPVIWLISRPIARDIRGLRDGSAIIAHWQPADEEWQRFEAAEWSRARREARLAPTFGLVLAVLLGALVFAVSDDALLGGLAALGGLAIGLLVAAVSLLAGQRRWLRAGRVTGEVRFSEQGVLTPHGYLPLRGINIGLLDMALEGHHPAVLRVRIGSVTEDLTVREQVFRIPVASGHEGEAVMLMARLTGQRIVAAA